ncbi:MAG: KH domain-containing protein [Kiritimatiellae bacterium]|nr:KH domain-containing protein [Kiritimatiellia bacterium]
MDENATHATAEQELRTMLSLLGIEGTVESQINSEEAISLHIESLDAPMLIGKNAQTLDALQYLLNRILYRKDDSIALCSVDVEHYRERRQERVVEQAHAAAEKAIENRRPVMLPPMNAAERRLAHQALKNNSAVTTWSEETDIPGIKRVVIEPT